MGRAGDPDPRRGRRDLGAGPQRGARGAARGADFRSGTQARPGRRTAPDRSEKPERFLRAAPGDVVTTSGSLRLQLIRDNGLAPEGTTSIPTGIDAARFIPGSRDAARGLTGLPPDRRLVGIVATLRSWKGHRYLIEALSRLPEDVGLVIVGDGPQRRNIESKIRELGVGDRVWLAGNQERVLPWLQSLDVFALPSYANEGVPQALVQ